MNAQVFGDGAFVHSSKVTDWTLVRSIAGVFVHVNVIFLSIERRKSFGVFRLGLEDEGMVLGNSEP